MGLDGVLKMATLVSPDLSVLSTGGGGNLGPLLAMWCHSRVRKTTVEYAVQQCFKLAVVFVMLLFDVKLYLVH